MKSINEFTIKNFYTFKMLLEEKEPDVISIMELFGIKDPINLPFDDYTKYWNKIQGMTLSTKGVKKLYNINGKRFKPTLDILKLNAGQFLDLQNYIVDYKIHQVLSVFLIPQYRKGLVWKTYNYADGYDVLETQNFILNNMTIGEANELATFFLSCSVSLLETMEEFSIKKLMKVKKVKNQKIT